MYINTVAYVHFQTIRPPLGMYLLCRRRGIMKNINRCICGVTTQATLLNYTEMEWKMRACVLVWCGDAVHSEQAVDGGHLDYLYSRTPNVILLISSS